MSSLTDIAKAIPNSVSQMAVRGPYKPYATLAGGVEVVVSDNKASMQGLDDLDIDVLVEVPTEDGFKSVRINIPSMRIEAVEGMSNEEVSTYRRFVAQHCSDIADRVEEVWNADNT